MGNRIGLGIGVVSTIFVAALTATAPQAAAQELAPGLVCEGVACDNNTENTYTLSGTATCKQDRPDRIGSHGIRENRLPRTNWGKVTGRITPHGRVTDLQVTCFGRYSGGTFETATVVG
ncbi:hypothetical protein ACFQZZ_32660 [Nocardia sp. GCM10030253]|uniref:hypothetical protein n=1 Tax=Nocardia sp. GCM10030253 TaxID=3273404 RepID=UPI00363E7045